MKAIQVNDERIIKEVFRTTDRVNNSISIKYETDLLYGTVYGEGHTERISFQVTVQKDLNPELWDELKDSSRDAAIQTLLDYCNSWQATELALSAAYETLQKDLEYQAEFDQIKANCQAVMIKVRPFVSSGVFQYMRGKKLEVVDV